MATFKLRDPKTGKVGTVEAPSLDSLNNMDDAAIESLFTPIEESATSSILKKKPIGHSGGVLGLPSEVGTKPDKVGVLGGLVSGGLEGATLGASHLIPGFKEAHKKASADAPIASITGNIGGSLLTGGAVSKGLSKAIPALGRIPTLGRVAAEGAIEAGAESAFRGNNVEEIAKDVLIGGGTAGTLGGIGTLASKGLKKITSKNINNFIDPTARVKAEETFGSNIDRIETGELGKTPLAISNNLKKEIGTLNEALENKVKTITVSQGFDPNRQYETANSFIDKIQAKFDSEDIAGATEYASTIKNKLDVVRNLASKNGIEAMTPENSLKLKRLVNAELSSFKKGALGADRKLKGVVSESDLAAKELVGQYISNGIVEDLAKSDESIRELGTEMNKIYNLKNSMDAIHFKQKGKLDLSPIQIVALATGTANMLGGGGFGMMAAVYGGVVAEKAAKTLRGIQATRKLSDVTDIEKLKDIYPVLGRITAKGL